MPAKKSGLEFSLQWPGDQEISSEIMKQVQSNYENLLASQVPGNDYLGWLDWPLEVESQLLERIEGRAKKIREEAELYVSTGIGGSYLGARAVIEALRPYGELKDNKPEIVWAGQNISGTYHAALLESMEQKDTHINVISKSGTTTETALAFRLLRQALEDKYGSREASRRITVTTSQDSGALASAAAEKGYEKFVIPEDVGGRFSVFTPVGLLPIAVAGIDIRDFLAGAAELAEKYRKDFEAARLPVRYAAARNQFYSDGGRVELFASFFPEFSRVGAWWQQLFGESEGKEGKGLYPATVDFTTDLHSLGQYIQDGPRHLLETLLSVKEPKQPLQVPATGEDEDGLETLAGRSFADINRQAEAGTRAAHLEGGVSVIDIKLQKLDPHNLGALLYFFMFSCALSALTLGVNPFDQPGVEAYKKNMNNRLF